MGWSWWYITSASQISVPQHQIISVGPHEISSVPGKSGNEMHYCHILVAAPGMKDNPNSNASYMFYSKDYSGWAFRLTVLTLNSYCKFSLFTYFSSILTIPLWLQWIEPMFIWHFRESVASDAPEINRVSHESPFYIHIYTHTHTHTHTF
jgi:hypothetical protein